MQHNALHLRNIKEKRWDPYTLVPCFPTILILEDTHVQHFSDAANASSSSSMQESYNIRIYV